MPIEESHPDFVMALLRGLSVIKCFDKGFESLTVSEVAARTDLNRAAARRFLLTLESAGYLSLNGRHFRLTPKVLELGYAYLISVPIWEQAQPFMKEIVDAVDESCSLGVLHDTDVVYLARVAPRHMFTVPVNVGTRIPAYVNAMGRVLLAEMDQAQMAVYLGKADLQPITRHTIATHDGLQSALENVRQCGYAIAEQEIHEGRCSIAVPIRNREGTAVAALNLSAMMSRASREDFTGRYFELLKKAAIQIGKAI